MYFTPEQSVPDGISIETRDTVDEVVGLKFQVYFVPLDVAVAVSTAYDIAVKATADILRILCPLFSATYTFCAASTATPSGTLTVAAVAALPSPVDAAEP